ncbi:hypothetical protein MSSAC_2787 [Methanosarcina siciliae C2J]|uniref:Terminase large subunit gp17-like C-terminal domain-containing protein n=2 Tax=Methanosarcina siciliae TaxID=38027 RepID=A0A0E3PNY7_9EURY|nr:hypothetical protein MSSAC_1013 [Methanosarcina siciliae C2J]AKB37377.1 hypothetical protein MSSAC_2787 [Methanosarcina siciliae C2J]
MENRSNLNPAFLERMLEKYQGTRLGRQELDGDILDDNPNALWKRTNIEEFKVPRPPALDRIVVGVDPATTANLTSNDTGIIVAGVSRKEFDAKTGKKTAHFYVLGDYTIHDSPRKWALEAVSAYHKHSADRVVGEVNNGGDLVEANIRTVASDIPYSDVHASRGKATRAEPVSSLYEQGRVHHVGSYPYLEDQMCDWVPGESESPDRIDALVWAITELMGKEPKVQAAMTWDGVGIAGGGFRV